MDSSFAADKLRQFPGGLFFIPSFRAILLLDDIEPVEITEKGWDSDKYSRENPGQDIKGGKEQKGCNDPVQCPLIYKRVSTFFTG